MTPSDYDFVCAVVRTDSGVVLGANKEYLIESRLAPLVRGRGDGDVASMIARVRAGSLVERGLLARTPDPADRRGVMVALTDAGQAEQRRVGGRHAVTVARKVGGRLTPDELADLERLCHKLGR